MLDRDLDNPIVLFVVLIVIAGAWAFIKIADEVGENETQHFDERILRSLRLPSEIRYPATEPKDKAARPQARPGKSSD